MNYYTAKFLREQKERPTEWVILPSGGWHVRLVHLGAWRKG